MSKNIGKNINEILSGKYSQKLLHHAKQSVTHALRTTWKYVIQKIVKATGDLIGNKIANRITNVSQNSQKNNSWAATNENYKEIPKERYISRGERQKIIDNLDINIVV